MSKYYIESNGIWKGKHQLSWAELCDELKQLEEENKQLKQTLQEVYNDDYYLKEFIIAIINCYSKNHGVSPIRLEMIWDASDMDKTSLKHLKSNFYE